MKILALDLGTKLGYTSDCLHGCVFTLSKDDSKFLEFREFLLKYLAPPKVHQRLSAIVYEAAAFQPGAAIPIYHGLVGVLKATAADFAVPVIGIAVGTIKKSFTGDGRADKQKVMDKCTELGYTYDDNNGADALAVWYTYKKLYGK